MKLEFLSKVCEHEHFIPLNLPFKTKCKKQTNKLNSLKTS